MRILVAGAGIGGLTFVHALQYFHHTSECAPLTIHVAERANIFRDGAGIVLHPNGLEVLESIGLGSAIHPFTNRIHHLKINRPHQQTTIPFHEVWGADKQTLAILRKDLHSILCQQISSDTEWPVTIQTGCRIGALRQEADKVFTDISTGDDMGYDLVVAADGVHSGIRENMFPDSKAMNTELFYCRFIAKRPTSLRADTWCSFEEQGYVYGFIPLTEDRVHCFVQLLRTEAPFEPGAAEAWLRENILPTCPLLEEAMQQPLSAVQSGFAFMVQPGNWHKGRIVLLGDAAHAVSPTLSEGGSLAMEDALTLSLALLRCRNISHAIEIYCQARSERCMRAFRMSLAQLNSLKKRRTTLLPPGTDPSQLMAGLYKPLLANSLPDELLPLSHHSRVQTFLPHFQTK